MVIVKKGGIQLHIRVEDGIKIMPFTNIPEILPSAKAIADIFKSILNYYMRSNPRENQIELVRSYFIRKEWRIEN